MKKSFGPKTWFFPLPVLIIASYNESNNPNAMNAAWGGIHDTNEVCICLESSHKSTKNILLNKDFTLSFATKKLLKESDYLGIESGNKVENKLAKANLHTIKSTNVNAPIIEEYPVTLECRSKRLDEIDGTTYVVADIVNILASEDVLDDKGKIDISKCEFISFNPVNNTYVVMGDAVGFAFKDGLNLR